MHQLTKTQRLENLEELIRTKELKVQRLQEEIVNLKRKREKLSQSTEKAIPPESTFLQGATGF